MISPLRSLGNVLPLRGNVATQQTNPPARSTRVAFTSQAILARHPKAVRFGTQEGTRLPPNLLWVTNEGLPYVGGLGMVTEFVPRALADHPTVQMDARVIMPKVVGTNQAIPGLTKTKMRIRTYSTFNGFSNTESDTQQYYADQRQHVFYFSVYQGQRDGVTYYALEHPKLMQGRSNLYYPNQDHKIAVNMLFDQAAGTLAHWLHQPESSQQDPSVLIDTPSTANLPERFSPKAPVAGLVINDALAAGTLDFLKQRYPAFYTGIPRIYFFHNEYGFTIPTNAAQGYLNLAQPPAGSPLGGGYSGVESGVHNSQRVIINDHYARRIIERHHDPSDPTRHVGRLLLDKQQAGQLINMHHGIPEEQMAHRATGLDQEGFTRLPDPVQGDPAAALSQFKQTNKAALQRFLGLRQDPEAVIFTYMGRFDPRQKGIHMILKNLTDFLNQPQYAKAQFVILGSPCSDPDIQRAVQEIRAKTPALIVEKSGNHATRLTLPSDPAKPWAGRIVFYDDLVNANLRNRVYAGSDFLMMPSLYEPFGLTQLEAMAMGCVPITNWVDGIRTTVADPKMAWTGQDGRQNPMLPTVATKWSYGQTGFMMAPFHTPRYMQHLDLPTKGCDPVLYGQAIAFYGDALQRAYYTATQDPNTMAAIRANGHRFVMQEHTWPRIVEKYYPPIYQKP